MNGQQLLNNFKKTEDKEIIKFYDIDTFKKIKEVEWFARLARGKYCKSIDVTEMYQWFEWFKGRNIPCILTRTKYNYTLYKEPFRLTYDEIQKIENRDKNAKNN